MWKSSWKRLMTGAAIVAVMAAALVLSGCEEAPVTPTEPPPTPPPGPTEPTDPPPASQDPLIPTAPPPARIVRSAEQARDTVIQEAFNSQTPVAIAEIARQLEQTSGVARAFAGRTNVLYQLEGSQALHPVVLIRADDERIWGTSDVRSTRVLQTASLKPASSTTYGPRMHNGGTALFLRAAEDNPLLFWDEHIPQALERAGYEVTIYDRRRVGADISHYATAEYMGRFDVVVIMSHGETTYGPSYNFDLGKTIIGGSGNELTSITPYLNSERLRETTGGKAKPLDGTYVILLSCRSADRQGDTHSNKYPLPRDRRLPETLIDLGASAVTGFTWYIQQEVGSESVLLLLNRMTGFYGVAPHVPKQPQPLSEATDVVRTNRTLLQLSAGFLNQLGNWLGLTEDKVVRASWSYNMLSLVAPGQQPFYIAFHDQPSFGDQRIQGRSFRAGRTISPLVLPATTENNGNPPYRYSMSPRIPGLTLDPSTRTLTGAPTSAAVGTHDVTYTVTDGDGDTATLSFTVTVTGGPLQFSDSVSSQHYTVGTRIPTLRLPVATGGVAPLRYRLTPVPDGLTFNDSARTLTGIPRTARTYRMTYTATDQRGGSASLTFTTTVAAAPPPVPVGAKIYWSSDQKVERSNLDGSGRETVVHARYPRGIAIYGNRLYWASLNDGIETVDLDGGNRRVLIGKEGSDLRTVWWITAHRDKLYYKYEYTVPVVVGGQTLQRIRIRIERANLDGSGREILIDNVRSTDQVVVDSGKMYFGNGSLGRTAIERADLNGGNRRIVVSGVNNLHGMAVYEGKIYWTDANLQVEKDRIERANLDGSNREILASRYDARGARGIVIYDGRLYWADFIVGIYRSGLNGDDRELLVRGRRFFGLAVVRD